MYFFGFTTWGFFFYVTLGLTVSGLGSDVFSWFLVERLFFNVTALALRVSALGSDVVFWFFDLTLLFLCYCAWFKGVGFRFWCIFLVFLTWGFFLYVTGLGLRMSGLGCDVLFWFFVLRLLFQCYCAWLQGVGFSFWRFFFFLGFSTWGFFFYVTALRLRVSRLGCNVFFWFVDMRLLFLFYCAWFKGFGFRYWCIFLVFRSEASFSMLLYLVLGCRV